MSPPLRVAVIGCGGIAQMMHLPTLTERPDLFTVVGMADVNPDTLTAVGRRFGVTVLTDDHRELLALEEVEAVLLLASGGHKNQVIDALRSGRHVFVEKPLAFSLEECEQIAEAARDAPGQLMVGYHKRHDPAYRRVAEEVSALRDLRFVEVTVLHPDDAAFRSHHAILPIASRTAPLPEADAEAGVRAQVAGPFAGAMERGLGKTAPEEHRVALFLLFQSLIHDINTLRGILGEPREVVSAHVWREGFAQTSLTRFDRDVRASLTWISVPGLKSYEERLRFVAPDRRLTLSFPSPYLRNAPTPLRIERMQGNELVVEDRTVSYEEAFRAELHHFRHCVREGGTPATSAADAVADARWIQAIAEAWRHADAGRVEP